MITVTFLSFFLRIFELMFFHLAKVTAWIMFYGEMKPLLR